MRQPDKDWLRGLGIEFWLPLPLLAIAFWLSCSIIADHVLSRAYTTKDKLKAEVHRQTSELVDPLMIQAAINQAEGRTHVEVQTMVADSESLRFELSYTNANQIEMAIAQKLALSRQDIRKLVRYEIVD